MVYIDCRYGYGKRQYRKLVKSLYTIIPNNEGTKAVRQAYDNHPNTTVVRKVIIAFLGLILTLNNSRNLFICF